MRAIVSGMSYLKDQNDVTNQIFIYLLGRKEEPEIAELLTNIYSQLFYFSIAWIQSGQQAGLINTELKAEEAAQTFITYAYGLRVRALIDFSKKWMRRGKNFIS